MWPFLTNKPNNTAKQRTNVEFSVHAMIDDFIVFIFTKRENYPLPKKNMLHPPTDVILPLTKVRQCSELVCSGGKQWGGSDDSKHKTQTRVTPEHHARLSQLDSNCLFVDSVWRKYASRCANPQQYTQILSTASIGNVSFMYVNVSIDFIAILCVYD